MALPPFEEQLVKRIRELIRDQVEKELNALVDSKMVEIRALFSKTVQGAAEKVVTKLALSTDVVGFGNELNIRLHLPVIEGEKKS